jgi:hypothetical protein
MMFVGFQQKGRTVLRCLSGAGPVPEACSSNWNEIAPFPDGRSSSPVGVAEVGKKRVCTMCTLWASDWGVLGADRAGFGRFSGEWRIFKGGSPVRVPPRAQCFRRSGAYWVPDC